jgi:hypothetical protein
MLLLSTIYIYMSKTRKNHVRGWKNEKPGYHQKTVMLKKCGKKCFLGKNKSFPICKKNTCKVSSKGVYAAYIRSRQYSSKGRKYRNISKKAKKMISKINK